MLCENCGKREANVRYEENINGQIKKMNLCEECSRELGIGNMDFNMPINFSNFLGGFLQDFENTSFMPLLTELKSLKCNTCGYTFDDIVKTGKLGCMECYDVFGDKLDPIIKRVQGENRHIGRLGKVIDKKIDEKLSIENEKEQGEKIENKNNSKGSKIEQLKEKLKQLIQDEKYEEAAKIRDEIKKLEK